MLRTALLRMNDSARAIVVAVEASITQGGLLAVVPAVPGQHHRGGYA
jgi:hypothetical protein